ncbi:GNAT family N-acetyltransferase [Gemmobacter nectariphilus]|uniref:GNAT family N-acetyltransferase n=1 Tax=Gemmobacter nectariphilus TaxID=220343 RepID=UPI000406E60C|nr:GNAT family N-acetyltransferase [Gemmobacter nectariphilus]
MTDITLRPVPVTDPQAQACLIAYYDELSRRFGTLFEPGVEPDPTVYDPPRGIFLLAERAGQVLGCVGLRPDGAGGEIKRLWVSPGARGLGLSRRLMAAVEQAARDLGYARLRLDTSRHLAEAIALYRRDGWAEIARYNDNPYADFFFEKALDAP